MLLVNSCYASSCKRDLHLRDFKESLEEPFQKIVQLCLKSAIAENYMTEVRQPSGPKCVVCMLKSSRYAEGKSPWLKKAQLLSLPSEYRFLLSA